MPYATDALVSSLIFVLRVETSFNGRIWVARKDEYIPKNFGELLETEVGLVGVFRISACGEGMQGCAVTKYTSCVKETLTSLFSSPSATDVNLIIAE